MPLSVLTVDALPLSGAGWSSWSSDSLSSGSDSVRRSPRSTTATPVPQLANVHSYKDTTERLELLRSDRRTVLMEDRPFASGGVCEAFRVWVLSPDGEKGPMQVAKRYIFKEGTKGFREDHVNWFMASLIVTPFNELLTTLLPSHPKVSLVPVVRLMEIRGTWYSLEDFIAGQFRKFNNIFGDVERPPLPGEDPTFFDLAAAFSHFSYCHSGNDYVILDVQGVDSTYTDCAVVSKKATQFGYTDTGASGLNAFLKKHTCNHICVKMGLRSLNANPTTPRATATSTAPAGGESKLGARVRVKALGHSAKSPTSADPPLPLLLGNTLRPSLSHSSLAPVSPSGALIWDGPSLPTSSSTYVTASYL